MRDILIVLGMCVAAIVIGAGLYFFGPSEFKEVPKAPVSQGVIPESEAAEEPVSVPVIVLESGSNAASVLARKNYAVYDAEDFAKLWKMAHGDDGKKLPSIDFAKSYVIGVFSGQKATTGYKIRVSAVTDQGSHRSIEVTLTSPGAGCQASQVITSPYQLVAVPISDAALSHTDKEESSPCK